MERSQDAGPLERSGSFGAQRTLGRASSTASVEVLRVELFEPRGHALAITIRVTEPHGFLRYKLRRFRDEFLQWIKRLEGIYVEVRDDDPRPVWVDTASPAGGGCQLRSDVECCAGWVGFGRGIDDEGPPPCPIWVDPTW